MRKADPIRLADVKLNAATHKLVSHVLGSGWISTGPICGQLEEKLRTYWQIPEVAAVNSASSGLIVALKACGVKAGDEVITTPLTFAATIEAILHLGARPVLVDICEGNLLIDPASVASLVTRRTSAILPVDLAGHPCDYRALRAIAKKHSLHLISDASHATAARYSGKSIPHWVDLAVFSLHATKNLTAGEGGIVAGRTKRLIDRVRLLSRHGMTSNAWQRRTGSSLLYDVLEVGFKANLSDLHAAVALGQFTTLQKEQRLRRRIAAHYIENLSAWSNQILLPSCSQSIEHAWHLFIIRIPKITSAKQRDWLMTALRADGIETGVHYQPIHRLAAFRNRCSTADLRVTNTVAPTILSLPMHAHLSMADVDRVCERLTARLNELPPRRSMKT